MINYKINHWVIKFLAWNLFLTILFVSLHCSARNDSKRINSLNNTQQNLSFQDNKLTETIDVEADKKDTEDWIKERATDFSIPNLKEKQLSDDEIELRIWKNSEYTTLNCLILHKKNKEWKAYRLSASTGFNGGFERTRQGKVIVNKKILQPPKNGWTNVSSYLIEKNIRVPLLYVWDAAKIEPAKDGGSVTLEIKEAENYSIVSYRELSKISDAKTVFEICSNLSQEFGIEMGCNL